MEGGTSKELILSVRKATKMYGGNYAIQDVDFDLHKGEVHALAGENGAGKTTLVKPLAGAIELTSGTILLDGEEQDLSTPEAALKAGIAMVYQETSLVPTMTVAQNIFLGKEKMLNRLRSVYIGAQQILQSMNFDVDPTLPVSRLGAAQKQMVEIARAVYYGARIIIFDEPTATLTPEEKMYFFELITFLRRRGVTIIFISHALEESLQIADRITVLRDGQHVITADSKCLTRELLVKYMVGREISQTHYGKTLKRESEPKIKKKILSVENVTMGSIVKSMTFSLYEGEIAGFAGLVGSGRTEIAKVIVGELKRNLINGGMIYLKGKPIRYRVPTQAINDGIAYVTEDRKREGFFETMTAEENIYLAWLATRTGHRFFVSKAQRRNICDLWIDRLKIRSTTRGSKLVELSGGNQQKVVIAKALVQKPKVVIFDEPTRGVDVGTVQEIHKLIRSLADEGVAILLISSYLPEVMSLSDRILVVRQGRIMEEFSPEDVTQEKIMFAAVH
jgi:ABC-type sugar transport system ATPase subunit